MSYNVNFTNNSKQPITVNDLSINNTDTSLSFIGKNYPAYAQFVGENFLHLLENFASTTEPSNAVEGQLWYDTSVSTLKIRDGGSRWVEASGIKRSNLEPTFASPGDLWFDTAVQQLFLYNSANKWVLIGPQFDEANFTGFKTERIVDKATNIEKSVVSIFSNNSRVAIYSTYEFSPKISIPGFGTIKQGVTLSTADFNNTGTVSTKYWGSAEKADALVVGNAVVPAASFVRVDTANTLNFPLTVRNSNGITIGGSLESSLNSSSTGLSITHTAGGSIFLRTTGVTTGATSVITATVDNKVGINTETPAVALDVRGDATVSGATTLRDLTVTGTTALNTVQLAGVSSSAEKFTFGPESYTSGVKSIIEPGTTEKFDIGSSSKKFNAVHADTVNATILNVNSINLSSGSFVGNVLGSATSLATAANFSINGELSSNTIQYNGSGSTVTFTTTIKKTFVSAKPRVNTVQGNDRFLIYRPSSINEPAGSELGSYNQISQTDLFSAVSKVPTGVILPFAGDTPPADYLLCDGAVVSRTGYAKLFSVIGTKYGAGNGSTTFALPDFRGRVGAGYNEMNNSTYYPGIAAPAAVSRNPGANAIASSGGDYQKTLTVNNLPQHEHDMKGSAGTQYYAINDNNVTPPDAGGFLAQGPSASSDAQYLPSSGKIKGVVSSDLSQPINIMNPFLTINYIIYTGGAA